MSKLKDLLFKLQTGLATNGSNLLNPEDVLDYVSHLGRRATSQSARLWVHRVLKNWLAHNKKYHKLCLPANEKNSLWLKLLPEVLDAPSVKEIHYVEVTATTPTWVVRGMASLTLSWFQAPSLDSEHHGELCHLVDYLNTLESVNLRMVVDDAMVGVRKWDEHLARQKFISEYHEGVEVCDSTAFEHLPDQPILVKLVSNEAYRNEGAAQSSCVASYFSKRESAIYSLRVPGEPKALATIEVKAKDVVQVKGPFNSALSDSLSSALKDWARQTGLTWFQGDDFVTRAMRYLEHNRSVARALLVPVVNQLPKPVTLYARSGRGLNLRRQVHTPEDVLAFSRHLPYPPYSLDLDEVASLQVDERGQARLDVYRGVLTIDGNTYAAGEALYYQPSIASSYAVHREGREAARVDSLGNWGAGSPTNCVGIKF